MKDTCKLSKYVHIKKIKFNRYAIYNSLLFEPIFISKNKIKKIYSFNTTKVEADMLLEKKIYVKKDEDDFLLKDLIKDFKNSCKRPNFAYFITTDACNLRCKYCFVEKNSKINHCTTMTEETAR